METQDKTENYLDNPRKIMDVSMHEQNVYNMYLIYNIPAIDLW